MLPCRFPQMRLKLLARVTGCPEKFSVEQARKDQNTSSLRDPLLPWVLSLPALSWGWSLFRQRGSLEQFMVELRGRRRGLVLWLFRLWGWPAESSSV